jgi:hypothetical protein
MKITLRTVLVAVLAAAAFTCLPSPAFAAFGLKEAAVNFVAGESGEQALQAGSHPFALNVSFSVNTIDAGEVKTPDEDVKDVFSLLPPGFVADPTATPRCSGPEFATINKSRSLPACPNESAVGVIHVSAQLGPGNAPTYLTVPVYNLAPVPGSVLKLGFVVDNVPVTIIGKLNEASPYNALGASTNISQAIGLIRAKLTLWGDPSDPIHDSVRGNCINAPKALASPEEVASVGSCPVSAPRVAFLTMSTGCDSPLQSTFEADSWQHPGPPYSFREVVPTRDSGGNPVSATGCAAVGFDPHIRAQSTSTAAESSTGLDFELNMDNPGLTEPESASDSAIERAVVTLPEGITTNPSVATGLGSCNLSEFDAESLGSSAGSGCPEASKVGEVEVESPLLEEEVGSGTFAPTVLRGSIYIAKQHDNPFDNLLTIYMIIRNPDLGIFIKLPGRVEPNPSTGQLKTTFGEPGYELPQLPFSHFRLHFFSGDRAPLITPAICGTYATQAELYPYSAPSSPRSQTATFTINSGVNGSSCASSPGDLPNRPSFSAGTVSPLAGLYTPFVLRLSREDGTQQFRSISTTLPEGLIGKLAGISYCPESGIAQASSRTGEGQAALELAQPSCPAASEVGSVSSSAGAGPDPFDLSTGHAYLAGPYKGAPLSLEIVVPAVAGPFDLGVVAVRTALRVDPLTAQITAESDSIPTILHGLPLDVRSIEINMSRPDFTVNPTSCEPKAISGTEVSTLGSSISLSSYFQVSNCGALKFKPKLRLSLKGSTKRTGHPALKAVLTYPKSGAYSNIARAQVNLPHSEFIEQNNLNKTCTKPVLLEGKCPAKSIYGKAKAWTPLLDKPLEGPVYLVGGFGFKLPALVAELNGQIRVLLVGKVDSGPNKGIRNTFEAVPDAPVEKFVLEMKGGPKYSLLINSENLCRKAQYAIARFTAQNGRVTQLDPQIDTDCKPDSKKARGRPGGHQSR